MSTNDTNPVKKSVKQRLEEHVDTFRTCMAELKKIEAESQPMNSQIVKDQLSKVNLEVTDEAVKRTLAGLTESINYKLDAYNDAINTHHKQVAYLTSAFQSLEHMVHIAISTVKATGWIIGAIIAIFTIVAIIRGIVIPT